MHFNNEYMGGKEMEPNDFKKKLVRMTVVFAILSIVLLIATFVLISFELLFPIMFTIIGCGIAGGIAASCAGPLSEIINTTPQESKKRILRNVTVNDFDNWLHNNSISTEQLDVELKREGQGEEMINVYRLSTQWVNNRSGKVTKESNVRYIAEFIL